MDATNNFAHERLFCSNLPGGRCCSSQPPGCLAWTILALFLQDCMTPLHLQYFTTTHAVLERNIWLLQERMTPLHWAARDGHLEVVEQLLGTGAAVEAKTVTVRAPSLLDD
jgi:hypothetical protein